MKKKYLGLKQQLLFLSLCSGSLMASPCQAGPTIPGFIGNTADVLRPIPAIKLPGERTIIQGIDSIRNLSASQMEITQNAPKAVIHWQTFDIGSDSSVNFNQQGNATWAALNVIGDASHKDISQIHGKLTADGKVYLINQNGIFFGPTAQVNVHSLTASSLNLSENDFINGYTNSNNKTLTFGNNNTPATASVENSGTITAADGGQVFLIGGKAVNSGTITANQGFVALAAGDTVTLTYNNAISRYAFPLVTTTGNTAEATNNGISAETPSLLQADEGIVGLYGGIVNQNGRAIATTAVSRNGQIELKGHSQVTTGAGSITATPVTASTERQTPPELETDIVRGKITVSTKEFIHQGAISSPGGEVDITSSPSSSTIDTIRLTSGSSIDVSGMWVDQSAEDRFLKVQLNSDVLKDAYALKYGPLLGETVRVDILNGMPAADISDYLDNRTRSAAEQLTEGGTITLTANRVEIAAGSNVDISGGGYKYAAGELGLTMVRVGSKIYTLSELPVGTPVDEVMGTYTREHTRYGVKETWNGLYAGGSTPLAMRYSSFIQGSDAGSLIITTPYLFMAGALDGWAERGFYQTEEEDKTYANGKTLAIGRRMPKGGSLTVGSNFIPTSAETAAAYDARTYGIAVVAGTNSTPVESESATAISTISSSIINNAGLSSLDLHANTTFSLAEDASIQLTPGGSFNASARKIDIGGDILVPGGSITLASISNKTSFSLANDMDTSDIYIPLEEKLTIHTGTILDVSGEEINNLNRQEITYGYTRGGTLTLFNQSTPSEASYENPDHGYDLTVEAGSLLSVQGGYWQDGNGKTSGTDAGSLVIRQDITENPSTQELPDKLRLTIEGELRGHALLGKKGGSLTIGANEMTILPAAGSPPPASPPTDTWDSIVFADNRFAGTGFSSITLNTYGDLTVAGGSRLEPSLLRRTTPSSFYGGGQPVGLVTTTSDFIEALPLEAGTTAISLNVGVVNSNSKLTIEKDSKISVVPNGKGEISLTTYGLADIGGTLEAPAGSIEITGKDITIGESARILAHGANLVQPSDTGSRAGTNWKVLDGGTVSLAATKSVGGSLTINQGSLIDVSGSPLVSNTIEDGVGNFFHRDEAGSPGSVTLAFYDNLTLNGTLTAESYLSELPGGTLTFKRTHNAKPLTVTDTLIHSLHQPGFDDLRLASVTGIDFAETATFTSSRRLVLDTPQLISSGGAITLDAPWVQIVNQQGTFSGSLLPAVDDPTQTLNAKADFIDITGNIRTNGFSTISLQADQDIRLNDWFYSGSYIWSGQFTLSGNLTLQANTIYPTTNNTYTINSTGLVSILPGQNTSAATVYSAGGSLTINAHDIYHAGALYAPMGNISLTADEGRVLLADGSLVSVSGSENVIYGYLDQDGDWKILDKTKKSAGSNKDMTAPEPSITISGKEVLVTDGARVEADGGGSLRPYGFLPGLDGSTDPLQVDGRLVIIPSGTFSLPELGEIYVEGYAPLGLAEGIYSILPAEYAFLPGALILERDSSGIFPGQRGVNLLNQPIIVGYEKAYGSNEIPSAMTGYVLRTATDVLTEGKYDDRIMTVNDGGVIDISGDTMVMLGAVSALGADNGRNGELTLAGTNINYGAIPGELRGLISMADIIPTGFTGSAWIDTDLTGGDGALTKLTLGNAATESVTFASGQTLKGVPQVVIKANDTITVNENAVIEVLATSEDEGVLELYTANLTTKAGSLLHASNELLLDIDNDWDFGGGWQVDDGRVHLVSSLFALGSDAASDPGEGLFMTQAMLNAFAGVKELWIESATDIRFVDSVSLAAGGSLQLDSQRLLFEKSSTNPASAKQVVSISADTLRLKNSHKALKDDEKITTATDNHTLQLNAQNLTLGPGTVRIDGFTDVALNTADTLFFEGQGELQAKLPGSGMLTMAAAGFYSAFPKDTELLNANRFSVSSGQGEVLFQGNGAAVSGTSATPGSLSITGRAITMDAALFDLPGGRIAFTATGDGENDGVLLKNGTRILARGGILTNNLGLSDPTAAVQFHLPGGEVLLSAASGKVDFEGGTANTIDVSATDNQDGGRVSIDGKASNLDLTALTLRGGGGIGGSFELATKSLPELGFLADSLSSGGFTNEIGIQIREGDVNLAAGKTLAARSITLAADGENDGSAVGGNITIAGTLSATGETGGDITIYAEQDLTLAATGRIETRGTTGAGGKVLLSSEQGWVKTDVNSTIDTTGQGAGADKDGTVTFRVGLTETQAGGTTTYGARLNALGAVNSGEQILQVVKSYSYDAGTSISKTQLGDITLANLSSNSDGTWIGDSYRFIAGLANNDEYNGFTLRPEIEVRSSGDLTLASGFQVLGNNNGTAYIQNDLANWRMDGLPGILTFRAGGNLNINTSLTDVPTSPMINDITGDIVKVNNDIVRDINPNGLDDSWALNFVAGADLAASSPLTTDAEGNLTIGTSSRNKVAVYSESGNINLAAGQDIKVMAITDPYPRRYIAYMPGVTSFTVGTFDGDIHARAGGDLDLSNTYSTYGGTLQSGIGDIDVETGGDILLGSYGSIRTTGRMPTEAESGSNYQSYYANAVTTYNNSKKTISDKNILNTAIYNRSQLFWEYQDGGDISIRSGGKIEGAIKIGITTAGWEQKYQDFGTPSTTYRWSANYAPSFNSIVTLGGGSIDIETGGNFLTQAGALGQNNEAALQILAKGDLDGQFLAMQGESLLSTLGSFGTSSVGTKDSTTGIGIGDVSLTIQAMGNAEAVTIYNPTLANAFNSYHSTSNPIPSYLSYSAGSSASINAFFGSALLTGTDNYTQTANLALYRVLPGSLTMRAGQDIVFTSPFSMAPALEGHLELLSGRDILGKYGTSSYSSLLMSDAPMSLYDILTQSPRDLLSSLGSHSNPPLHKDDNTPVQIEARRDISNISFTLPKAAEIIAGRDLLNIRYSGQHLHANDVSILSAGRDFQQKEINSEVKTDYQGITQAGPGSLLVQAGNSIDLANSSGIRSIGSSSNTAAQDENIPLDANGRVKGSDITVIAGYDTLPSTEEISDFITKVKSKIREVSALIAEGKESEAAILKEEIRAELFTPFLYDHRSGTGDLNMTTSGIQTVSGEDAINIFAAGDVNVGVTTIETTATSSSNLKDTGIFTAGGGAINLIAGQDVNVNESRVMTFLGGDIVVLSDNGDINAGRGSKAKVTAAEPQIVETNGVKSVIFSPPAVGSGLRTLAYDPDGNGPKTTPEPGDMYVVAWDGVVDAGEAGIEGGNLYLAATKVLNSQNISVGAGSVGLPAASGAVASLGALTGDSMSATESTTSNIAESTTAGAGEKMAETAKKIADTISQLRFFVVKFLGFME